MLHSLAQHILADALSLVLRRRKPFEHFRLAERSVWRMSADVPIGETREGNVIDEMGRRRGRVVIGGAWSHRFVRRGWV